MTGPVVPEQAEQLHPNDVRYPERSAAVASTVAATVRFLIPDARAVADVNPSGADVVQIRQAVVELAEAVGLQVGAAPTGGAPPAPPAP